MKTALITGASRGIGAAAAEHFAKNGWRVIINYNSSEGSAGELCEKLRAMGHEAFVCKADVGSSIECEALVKFAESFEGHIDALVNNAAIDEMELFHLLPPERERRLFDVNLFGAMNCARFAIYAMLRHGEGSIVNVSSIWGQLGASCEVQYSTSKAALIGFTKALSKELAPSGIRVNCISPGIIDTDMNAGISKADIESFCEDVPLGRMGKPCEVAEGIFYLANAKYVTGQVLGVNGGFI